ncbi:MAG: PKD domain-containing protein [Flavobacteriales bacterium]
MKKDFNNIEEVFKNAFDSFEANVDPSVWNNIQSTLGSGGSVLPNQPSSLIGGTSKAVLTKIIAGVVVATGIVTSYYIATNDNKADSVPAIIVAENNNESNQGELSSRVEKIQELTATNVVKETVLETISQKTTVGAEKQKSTYNSIKSENKAVDKQENKSESTMASNQQSGDSEVVTVANNSASSTSLNNKKVVEQIALTVKIKASQTTGKAPLDVEFNVDGNAVAYSWDFGDGSEISGQENSFHTFTNPGKYTVKLTAIDKNANAKTVLQIITVEQNIKSTISAIPTVFSPNADGINDVIKVEGENIKTFHAIVRDSKGNLVYEWKTLEGFWDGRDLNNQILPKGTYYIVVVAVGVDGKNHTKKQTIQLF